MTYSRPMPLRSGFPGERISALPKPRVVDALKHLVTSKIMVTDCGYFPHAADHYRMRRNGMPQAIVIVCTDGLGWCEIGRTDPPSAPGPGARRARRHRTHLWCRPRLAMDHMVDASRRV